jgi:hypothetical protein
MPPWLRLTGMWVWEPSGTGDIEFWNRSVDQTLVATGEEFSYAPIPNQTLTPNWATVLAPGTVAPSCSSLLMMRL